MGLLFGDAERELRTASFEYSELILTSPGQYLRHCRIEKVRELLTTSELPLADLALAAGFSDQSQLTTAFRRATGFTPGAFRRSRT